MLPSACCQVITSLHVGSFAIRLHRMDYIRDAPVELSQELLRNLVSTYSVTHSLKLPSSHHEQLDILSEEKGGRNHHLHKHVIRFHLCHFSRKHVRLPVPKTRSTVLSIHAITLPLVRLNRFSGPNASASPTELTATSLSLEMNRPSTMTPSGGGARVCRNGLRRTA